MKKSNFIKYSILLLVFFIALIIIVVSWNNEYFKINESLVYGIFCSVLVALIVEIGNDIRNLINRIQTKSDIMSSTRYDLFYLLNQENYYLALAIKALTGKNLFIFGEKGINQKDIVKSIKRKIDNIQKLYSETPFPDNQSGIDKVTVKKKRIFYKYFCSYKCYEILKDDISKLLNNKDLLLSQNIISEKDIRTLISVEILLDNICSDSISENSEFKNISMLIDDKKTFFNDYTCKLLPIINYDSKKLFFEKVKSNTDDSI